LNRVSPEDLEVVLPLPDAVAVAVVEYRTQNGRFHDIADLQRAPGLDLRQIQEARARIIFTDA
jgi:DNA uptake protein ComE-like DNA-binding protein